MISVVIASHNRIDSLRLALESVYQQTELPNEIVVVDDASTIKVPQDIFINCPHQIQTQLIRNETSLKASGARNVGIKNATSDYVSFLDDDDQFMPTKIEEISDLIKKENLPDVIYHAAKITLVNERISYFTKPGSYSSKTFFNEMLISNKVGGTSMVIGKKSALLSVGLFDQSLPAIEDYELWLRLAKNNYRFVALDKVLTKYFYKTKALSVSKDFDANYLAREMIITKYADDFSKLTFLEKLKMKDAYRVQELQRHLLNYNYFKSIAAAIKMFLFYPSVKNSIRIAIVFLGSRFSFKVRSWM